MSEWTVNTLKEHFDALLIEKDRALQAALVANEKRLDGLNELRQGVATTVQIDALEKVVDDIKERLNHIEGNAQGSQVTKGNIYTAIGVGVGIITVITAIAKFTK